MTNFVRGFSQIVNATKKKTFRNNNGRSLCLAQSTIVRLSIRRPVNCGDTNLCVYIAYACAYILTGHVISLRTPDVT